MKKTITILFLFLSALTVFSQAEKKAKSRIAVTKVSASKSLVNDLNTKGGIKSLNRILESMNDNLSVAIQNTRRFEVLTRSDIDAVIAEQDFAQSGNADISDKRLPKSGMIKGAEYIVTVAVDDYQDYTRKRTFKTIGETTEFRTLRYGAIVKIIDATSGSIKESANFTISNQDVVSERAEDETSGGSQSDALISKMARTMCSNMANKIADIIFPPKILAVSGKIATFNRGDGAGVSIGDEYNVFAAGEDMIDEDTGENLGAEELLIGKIKVVSVAPKFSKGEIVGGNNGISKGNILRICKKSPESKKTMDEEF